MGDSKLTEAAARSVRRDRVKYLLTQSSISMFLSPLAGTVLALTVWGDVAGWKLLVFNLGLGIIAALRLALHRTLPREKVSDKTAGSWERRLVFSIFVSAFWWGAWGVTMISAAPLESRLVIFTFLMMLSCAGSLRYAVHPAAAFTLPLTMSLPAILYFGLSSQRTQVTFALAGCLFIASILHAVPIPIACRRA